MMSRRRGRMTIGTLALVAISVAMLAVVPADAGAAVPIGGVKPVNGRYVASDAAGDFVVVARTSAQVTAQRYDYEARPVGARIVVATTTGDLRVNTDDSSLAVAMNADGRFVVGWQVDLGQGQSQILARTYASTGIPVGDAVRADTPQGCCDYFPRGTAVGIDGAGRIVVVWSVERGVFPTFDADVRLQRFDAGLRPIGGQTIVSAPSANTSGDLVSVAMNASGAFVVSWTQYVVVDQTSGQVKGTQWARLYRASGEAGGSVFLASDSGAYVQYADVAIDLSGGVVIAWSEYLGIFTSDGAHNRVRLFSASGAPRGPSTIVETSVTDIADRVSVTDDAYGRFVVAWTAPSGSGGSVGPTVVFVRQYGADGSPFAGQVAVSTDDNADQFLPDIAADADGDFVALWQRIKLEGGGGRVRRVQGPEPVDLAAAQTDSPDPVASGAQLSYTITAANLHAVSTLTGIAAIDSAIGQARGVHLTDALPKGVTGATASGTGWTCTYPGGRVVCDYAPLLRAGTLTATLTITVTAPAAGRLTNKVTITSEQLDPNPANNRDTESTTVT